MTLLDGDLPLVPVYAVEHDVLSFGGLTGSVPAHERVLGSLIGRTRAAVLRGTGSTCTTTELARRLGVSPASVSRHAAVLRDAGSITTRRQGSSVLHSLSPLGIALLRNATVRTGSLDVDATS